MFKPGHNCANAYPDQDVRVFIDGQDYFEALAEALPKAKRTIYIAGWAFDFKTWLRPDEPDGERLPLGPLLRRLISQNQELQVYVLVWDLAEGFLLRSDPFRLFRKRTPPHRRLHFRYDKHYPFGASQHQKFVVIDDSIAFIGGIDLTVGRWDTRQHLVTDRRRIDPYGTAHGPFHDAHTQVQGQMAELAGEMFRTRWSLATRKPAVRPSPYEAEPIEGSYTFRGVEAALSRTDPNQEVPVREVESLFEDSIASAKSLIYIENQYLTSREIGEMLARRLQEPDGPEVVIIGPRQPAGWAEEITVGLLRWRVVDVLRKADVHDRLGIYYPMSSVEQDITTYVHIKLTMIDDAFVRIGSANVSRRSMRVDSELDIAFQFADETNETLARQLRESLLAEHLGLTPEEVAAELERDSSVLSLVRRKAGGNDRTLVELGGGPENSDDRLIAQDADLLVDPAEPIDLLATAEAFVGRRLMQAQFRSLPHGFFAVVGICLVLLTLRYGLPDELRTGLRSVSQGIDDVGILALPVAMAGVALLSSLGVNLFVLTLLMFQGFGVFVGLPVTFGSVLGGALLSYGYGRILGRHWVNTLFGIKVQAVRRRMFRRGAFSVAMLRLFPVSRFHTVGAVSGASEMRPYLFTFGTVLGLALPFLGISIMAYTLLRVLREATWLNLAILVGVLALYWSGINGLEKGYQRWRNRQRRGTTTLTP